MQFLEEEILEITETTWNSLLDLDIRPSQPGELPHTGVLRGQAEISGAWEGVVIIYGSNALARSAASKVFSIALDAVQEQDQIDVVYELANIIAGNIKSLLPEPCRLGLPQVQPDTEWLEDVPGADRVSELHFDCAGEPLLVTVWKRRDG